MQLLAMYGGPAKGWRTPKWVPRILRQFGYEPDLYVCDRTPRLQGVRVDSDLETRPTIAADMNHLPFRDGAFRCGFFDPPYSVPYHQAINELARVCREKVAVLHIRDVNPPKPKRTWTPTHKVLLTCGPDTLIRCLILYRRVKPAPGRPRTSPGRRSLFL